MKTKILMLAGLAIFILCTASVASDLAPVANGISQVSCIGNVQSVPCEAEEPAEDSNEPNDPNTTVPE